MAVTNIHEALGTVSKTVETPILSKEIVEEIAKMMPKEKIEKTPPREVLCKMVIKGKASKLQLIIDNVINTYYRTSSSYQSGFDKELIVTLMIEEGEDKEVKSS
jgi:hypothetical protein